MYIAEIPPLPPMKRVPLCLTDCTIKYVDKSVPCMSLDGPVWKFLLKIEFQLKEEN
jgi:hypothetical protein